jgi:hypothetical protein
MRDGAIVGHTRLRAGAAGDVLAGLADLGEGH